MHPKHYIGIDLGAESGRVMLGKLEDGRLELTEMHRFSNGVIRLNGTLRWDLLRIWEEIKAGLRKVARAGVQVESISVDSWALDYVLMGKTEPMLAPPYAYRDARTEKPYVALRQRIGEERIYECTGIQFMPINTLYHLAAEAEHAPELHEASERFLMIGDWFHYLLTGNPVQEESNASSTQLWDPVNRVWSLELANRIGLRYELLPQVVPPCTRLGRLLPAIAAETGLPECEVVAGCVHDTGAAVAAVPADPATKWAYLSSGTWSLFGVELPKPLITEAARKANFTNETGVDATTRFLRNASGMWMLQECRRVWAAQGKDYTYEDLTRHAESATHYRGEVDAASDRFLRPADMVLEIQAACRETGQPVPATEGEIAQCILQSLAALYARMSAQLAGITGQPIDLLHIVGGGSRNALLNQMTANALRCPVEAGPVEATVIGNILLQALTLGHIKDRWALREIVKASFPVQPYEPQG